MYSLTKFKKIIKIEKNKKLKGSKTEKNLLTAFAKELLEKEKNSRNVKEDAAEAHAQEEKIYE